MELSSVPGHGRHQGRVTRRRTPDGAPVVTYQRAPGLPVGTARFTATVRPPGGFPGGRPHVHDFLLLTYFEAGGGSMRVNHCDWPVAAGDALVVAPGDLVSSGDATGLTAAEGWCVFFPPDVLAPPTPGAFQSWRAHPLLFPFTAGAAGARRLHVPPPDRPTWSRRIQALDHELRQRQDGHTEAALAHLTLLLVSVSRLAADVAGDLRLNDEPLLATVFDVIEALGQPVGGTDLGRDHPGPSAAGVRAGAGVVRRGGGPGRRGADPWGVPGELAADGGRRVRVGRPGHEGERGGVRLCRGGAGPVGVPEPVTLTRPEAAGPLRAVRRTASGSIAVPKAVARVARASRLWVEGLHDAALVERVWGDDLRVEGVVVEPVEGVDALPGRVHRFGAGPGRRVGVLVDHLVPGSKESRIAAAIADPHVLVVGHPYVDAGRR